MAGMVLKCRRCGHDLPPLDEESQKAFLAGGSRAVAEHEPGQCPHELAAAEAAAATAPVQRRFRATLVLVEVLDEGDGPVRAPTTELLGQFVAEVDAPTPGAAMDAGGELVAMIGEKWSQQAQLIDLADVPAVPPQG